MFKNFNSFAKLEDKIVIRKVLIDIAGGIIPGIVLKALLDYLDEKSEGEINWYYRYRLNDREINYGLEKLKELGLIEFITDNNKEYVKVNTKLLVEKMNLELEKESENKYDKNN